MKHYTRRLFFCCLLFTLWIPALLLAQGKKPEVLVYGDGIDAYAAAVQAAKSRLNTVWVMESGTVGESLGLMAGSINSHRGQDAGIWADLMASALGAKNRSDSLAAIAKKQINPQLILNAAEKILDSIPHLSVIQNGTMRSAKKGKRQWTIELSDRRKYKVRAVVDASPTGLVAKNAGLTDLTTGGGLDQAYLQAHTFLPLMRTGVAVSDLGSSHPYTLPLTSLIPGGGHNIFFTKNTGTVRDLGTGTLEDLPLMAHLGQAVGAAAAYVAFFKTTADKIQVRQIQGELLQYGARLIPYQDIPIEDPNLLAIQRIGATGLLQPLIGDGTYHFAPDAPVSSEELRPVMNQLYSRSQIWFTDHHYPEMNLSDLVSLIKYISYRGNELEGQIERAWSRKFRFEGTYDPNLRVSRRHVAVLLDEYCKPFDVRIGIEGQVQR